LRSPYQLAVSASRWLRRIGYDSAVILRPDHWWGAMLAHLAGIPRIIGYDLPDVAPFLTDKIDFSQRHAVEQNLQLLEYWTGKVPRSSLIYRFPVSEVDSRYIDGYLEEWGIDPYSPLLCIHPGSGTWVKQWEEAKWATVADTLGEQLNASVIFTGGDHESQLITRIAGRMRSRACLMAGDTQVGQLAALFARAKVVLGPDSGPLHLAVAAGAPTVTIFGPANPAEFGPWGSPDKNIVLVSDIGCRPCGVLDWGGDDPANHPCVREITVGRVLDAARRAANYET
jgi:ADP-heptose:LPS heptosyltransferase